MQTLRTVEISGCLVSVSSNKPLELARLTRLSLTNVKLLSDSFSCNVHSLEELKLDQCSGIKEFKLSSRSMKRLEIHNISKPFKATIDAPIIASFHYKGILPQYISFATTSSSDELWKSKIDLGSSDYIVHCFNELYGLIKAVSQSEISLELDEIEIQRFQSQNELPIAVEHLTIRRTDRKAHPDTSPFLNMLFSVFRPSFIYSNYQRSREIAKLLLGMTIHDESYMIWKRVLEGVGLQVYDWKKSEWKYTTSSLAKVFNNLRLRIHLKWRE